MFIPIQNSKLENPDILIISSIAIGSVGQIASELIISNNDFQKIGYLKTDNLKQIFCLNTQLVKDCTQSICLPAEVFQKQQLTFLLLRGQVKPGQNKKFKQEILDFSKQFKKIIILSQNNFKNCPDIMIERKYQEKTFFISNKIEISKILLENDNLSNGEILKSQEIEKLNDIVQYNLARFFLKKQIEVISLFQYSDRIYDIKKAQKMIISLAEIINNENIIKKLIIDNDTCKNYELIEYPQE